MKAQIFSDIHCEAYADPAYVWRFITPQAPVAIIAGDIDARKFEATVTEIASKFEKVICVLGNHEFYHKNIRWTPTRDKMPTNVSVLNRNTIEYEDINFIGVTLWTDMKNNDWLVTTAADKFINDFRMIKDKKVSDAFGTGVNRFTAHAATKLHMRDKNYLYTALEENKDKKNVVITHFMPSYKLVREHWKTASSDTLNWYFSSNCDELVANSGAKLWVCGHTHDFFDEDLYGVRCVCNPYGYPGENKNKYQDLIIDI